MRVVLIRPLYRTPSYDPDVQEALGIETLAAVARAAGHAPLILDAMLSGQSEETTARRAAAFAPDVVAFSMMSPGDLASVGAMASVIAKNAHPLFVAGGTLASTQPETIAREFPGFVCIRYEGEAPLLRLLGGSGEWGILAGAPVDDLDALPDAERPMAEALVAAGRTLNVQASRGCTGTCAYCCAPSFPHPPRRPWRAKSPERVAAEMAGLHRRYGATGFHFVDDDFLGPPSRAAARAIAVRDALARRRLRVAFGAQLRPQSLSDPTIDALLAAGVAYIYVGFETDDGAVLRRWRRAGSDGGFWRAVKRLRAAGVEVQVGCIPFHPQATVAGVTRLFATLHENGALNYRTATNRLQLLPGSRLAAGATCAATPPIACEATERLHAALVAALQPLRPCWVQAMSRLPHSVAAERTGQPNQAAELRATLAMLDGVVAETAHALICGANAAKLQRSTLAAAEKAAQALAACGAATSYEAMRAVIRSESGV